MKKLSTFLISLMIVGFIFAQEYDLRNFRVSGFDHYTIYEMTENIQVSTLRGTGIDNAVEFNNWSAHIPFLADDLRPNGWILQSGNPDANRSEDSYIGSYAMHVETGYIENPQTGVEELFGGLALVGDVAIDWGQMAAVVTQGEPYTERPSSMTFYIKGELLDNDTAIVLFQSSLNTELIGLGGVFLGSGDVSGDYIGYTVPIDYENENIPDSAMIVVASAASGMFLDPDTNEPMEIGTVTDGSYIIVDHITFNFTSPVEFRVENTEGDEIEGAHISIFDAGTTDLVEEMLSDSDGEASFNLGDGNFDYLVTLEGYIDGTGTFTAETQDETIVVVLDLHDGPQVLERTPEVNETMVALDAEVSVTFTEDIFEIDFDGITILDQADVEVENIVVNIVGDVLTIGHDDFNYNETYTVVIPLGTIEDGDENPLAFDISWSFSTINPIADIHGVDDVDVFFNTDEEDAKMELAQETTIEDITGGVHTVALTWEITGYDQITPGTYDAVGTFELPEGVHQSEPAMDLEVHATVTVLEAPVIVDIDVNNEVEDIEVPYETPEVDAISHLVSEITISDSDGGEHIVILDWTIDGYDGETPGDYDATGTFTLPFGVDQTDPETDLEVHAKVTVMEKAVIAAIDINNNVADVEVMYGTTEMAAIDELAGQITIEDSYGVTYTVNLAWTIEDYNAEESGSYDATGTFVLPAGVYQTDPETDLEVHATVTVLEKATIAEIDVQNAVSDIEVDYGTSETAAINALAGQIIIKDSYDNTYLVNVSWTIDNYDGQTPATYSATGTFVLPAVVYQTDPETDLEVHANVTVLEGNSVELFGTNEISVYPNPTTGFVNIENADGTKVTIMNISGQVLEVIENTNTELVLDLSKYAEGLYLIRVDNQVFRVNLVK